MQPNPPQCGGQRRGAARKQAADDPRKRVATSRDSKAGCSARISMLPFGRTMVFDSLTAPARQKLRARRPQPAVSDACRRTRAAAIPLRGAGDWRARAARACLCHGNAWTGGIQRIGLSRAQALRQAIAAHFPAFLAPRRPASEFARLGIGTAPVIRRAIIRNPSTIASGIAFERDATLGTAILNFPAPPHRSCAAISAAPERREIARDRSCGGFLSPPVTAATYGRSNSVVFSGRGRSSYPFHFGSRSWRACSPLAGRGSKHHLARRRGGGFDVDAQIPQFNAACCRGQGCRFVVPRGCACTAHYLVATISTLCCEWQVDRVERAPHEQIVGPLSPPRLPW